MGMHFISYSRRDGRRFAEWLYDALWRTAPATQPWMDPHDRVDGVEPGEQIEDAIGRSESLLFVWSRDARNSAACRSELEWADRLARPIVPLQIHPDAERPVFPALEDVLPFFSEQEWPSHMTDLLIRLEQIASPAAQLEQSMVRLRRREQELQDASEADRPTLRLKVAAIQREHNELLDNQSTNSPETARERDAHPPESRRRAPADLDRQAEPLGRPAFRDREEELADLSRFIQDDGVRIVSLTGPEGIGKTRMARQLLDELRSERNVTGIDEVVSLTSHPTSPVTAARVLEALQRRISVEFARYREEPIADSDLPLLQKLDALLVRLATTRIILMIDGFEALLDERTGNLEQPDLDELLRRLAARRDHRVTVLLVSRRRPEPLLRGIQGWVGEVHMELGLPLREARNYLRSLDPDNVYRLGGAHPALLDRACALTQGHPRALQALLGNLMLPDSPYTSLGQLLEAAKDVPPREALDFLVSQMFRHLDLPAWYVAQALAIYSQPVTREAIKELLRPYIGACPIESGLDLLLQAGMIRQEKDRYVLPPPNDARVLKLIRKGQLSDQDLETPPFTRYALQHRAATLLGEAQTEDVRGVDDLRPRLSQINLLIRGEEHEAALRLIEQIDERYLARWGFSQILTRQREQLRYGLEDGMGKLANLNALALILERNGDLLTAADHYKEALKIAKQLKRNDIKKKLHFNLASLQMAHGWPHQALDHYTEALRLARARGGAVDTAAPLLGLAEYHAHIGAFPTALQYAEETLALVHAHNLTDLGVQLHWFVGRVHGQLGETVAAIESLRGGLALAEEQGNRQSEGKLIDGMAEVLIDQGRLARATTLAEKAVEIGVKINSPTLRREAGFTLAHARLCMGDLNAAEAAAEMACAYRRPGQAPFLLALRGAILLQLGRSPRAEQMFQTTLGEVEARHQAGPRRRGRNYALLDLEGVVRCGLALATGQLHGIKLAQKAFQEAREVTQAPGHVARVVRLLGELEEAGPPGALSAALRAASGGP
jgi:tetratricopeptide (TPR) repeat protein